MRPAVCALLFVFLACSTAESLRADALESKTSDAEFPGNKYVKARFALENSAIAPAGTTNLAVIFDILPGWHLYWRNPGDAGLPPSVTFTPVLGVKFAAPQWPAPRREIAAGSLINFVYERQLVLIFPIETIPDWSSGTSLKISAQVDWMVCKEKCIPGRAQLTSSWPVSAGAGPSADADVFNEARKRHPQPASAETSPCEIAWNGSELHLGVTGADRLAFFPYENSPNVYPENLLYAGESRSGALRLRYPADVAKLEHVAGVLAVTRDGVETFHEISTSPPSAEGSIDPVK